MNKTILEVLGVNKTFGNKQVLNDITFSLRQGEVLGILGKNGTGKTTLLNIIIGLIKPDRGQVKVFGKLLEQNLQDIQQRINIASSFQRLQAQASILENLYSFAGLYGVSNPSRIIESLLEDFDILKLAQKNKKMAHLSAGEHTRALLCKAFLNNPELLLLDEPLSSLDPLGRKKTLSILHSYVKNYHTSILYASHNITEISSICKRVMILKSGMISYDGPMIKSENILMKLLQ